MEVGDKFISSNGIIILITDKVKCKLLEINSPVNVVYNIYYVSTYCKGLILLGEFKRYIESSYQRYDGIIDYDKYVAG